MIIAQTMDAVYYPGENINTIGLWEEQSAYKVKTLAPCTLQVYGDPEDNLMLGLDVGWSLIPVIAPCPVNVVDLFQPAGENLIIVKDVANVGVYWPAMSINSIGELLPGKAYFVRMSSYGEVEFPYCGKNLTDSEIPLTGFQTQSGVNITSTPTTHTIAILPLALKGFERGTIIGAYDQNGNCFGATVYNRETISLTVFGDDPATAEKDGFFEGEMMLFKNLSGLSNLTSLEPTFDPSLPQSDGLFTENGLSAITGFEAASGIGIDDFGAAISIYPNPTTGVVNISGLDGDTEITIKDAVGQMVLQQTSLSKQIMTVDLGGRKPGVYFVGLKQDGKMIFKKLVLR